MKVPAQGWIFLQYVPGPPRGCLDLDKNAPFEGSVLSKKNKLSMSMSMSMSRRAA